MPCDKARVGISSRGTLTALLHTVHFQERTRCPFTCTMKAGKIIWSLTHASCVAWGANRGLALIAGADLLLGIHVSHCKAVRFKVAGYVQSAEWCPGGDIRPDRKCHENHSASMAHCSTQMCLHSSLNIMSFAQIIDQFFEGIVSSFMGNHGGCLAWCCRCAFKRSLQLKSALECPTGMVVCAVPGESVYDWIIKQPKQTLWHYESSWHSTRNFACEK
jgi:hypothetical protein